MARVQSRTSACRPEGTPWAIPPAKVERTSRRPSGTATAMIARTRKAASTSSRFETGPASVVRLSSRTILRKLRVMTGVGLAQPTSMPLKKLSPMKGPKIISAGKSRVPTGSTWTMGLSETRPIMRAVWSPSREAVQAWAHSCTLSEKSSRTNSKTAMMKALDRKRTLHGLEDSG